MRARRIALYTTGGLVAVLAAVIAWAWFADLGVLKPQIERWVTEKTGRTFVIEGPLSIDLAGQTVVVAEGVRLQNASWDTPDDMVVLDRVEVRLDLGSLLGDGPVIIDRVDVDGLQAVLTRRDDGVANWEMGASEEPAAESTEPGKGVVLRQATVDTSRVQYNAPARNEPLVLTIDSLNHQHRDDDFLDLNFAGSLSDEVLTVDGEIGTWPNLLAASNVQYALEVSLGDFDVTSEGVIDDLAQPVRPTLSFTARGPDIDELTRALKMGADGSGDINLSGSLGPGDGDNLVLAVDGNLGRTQIDASGGFSDLRDLENFDMVVSLAGPDVRPILALMGIRDDQPEPFDLQFEARRDGPALIVEKATAHVGSAELHFAATVPQFPEVQDSVVSLTIQGPHIERFRELLSIPGVVTGPFSLGFTMDIDDTGIHILNLGMETEIARMTADGGLGRAPDYFGTSLNFDLQTDDLGRMAAAYGIEDIPGEPAAITGQFEYTTNGIETRSEFSSVTGETRVLLDGTIAAVSGVVGTDVQFSA